jgi:hypothetical protein
VRFGSVVSSTTAVGVVPEPLLSFELVLLGYKARHATTCPVPLKPRKLFSQKPLRNI